MSRWFTKHQERTFFAVTLIRKPKPAVTGQNSIFWGFSGYTGDISQGIFLLRNGIYGQKNTGNDDELPDCSFLDLFRKSCLFILLAVLTGFWGMNAFLLYLLFHGIVWQLVVSLRLHTLKEKGLVSRSHDISHWIVYVYSIPVKEERAILKNPCFALEQNMKDFSSACCY